MNNPVVRGILGVLAGMVAAIAVVFVVEGAGHALFPPPAGLDITDPVDQERLVAWMPASVKAIVVLGWFLGSFAGATTAMKISRRALPGWIVAAAMVALSVATTLMFPHPAWMIGAAAILPLVAAWLAARLVARRTASSLQ